MGSHLRGYGLPSVTWQAYLQINGVAPELRAHILEFYEYLYTSTQSMDDLRLYQDLPPSLATRLAITVHRRVVSRAPFLYVLSDDALLSCLSKLRALVYVPSQVVLIEGQPLNAIYFVKKGKVLLLHGLGTPDEREVRRVGQYENFGLSFAAVNTSGARTTDAEVASQLLETQYATEWARAETCKYHRWRARSRAVLRGQGRCRLPGGAALTCVAASSCMHRLRRGEPLGTGPGRHLHKGEALEQGGLAAAAHAQGGRLVAPDRLHQGSARRRSLRHPDPARLRPRLRHGLGGLGEPAAGRRDALAPRLRIVHTRSPPLVQRARQRYATRRSRIP